MTNLTEQNQYEDGIYQIEKSDPVVGGADGISNRQANQLANRTRWLKTRLDGLLDGSRSAALATRLATPRKINGVAFDGSTDITVQDATKAPLDSPTLTGKPIAPRPAPGTTSDQVQTAAGVLAQLAAFGVGSESANGMNLDLNQAALGTNVHYEGTQGKAVEQHYPRVISNDAALVAFNVITHGLGNRTVQLAIEVFGTSGARGRSFIRVKHDSTWFDWRELTLGGERIGAIDFFATPSAPPGYLKANGAAVSRTTYVALFAAIGTTFGAGDGSTTFNLPDLRGEFIRGWDDSRGVDSGRTFGSLQSGQNASHSHTATASNAGAHSHTTSVKADRAAGDGNAVFGDENWYGDLSLPSSTAGDHSHTISIAASGGNEARPRNIALLACIKY